MQVPRTILPPSFPTVYAGNDPRVLFLAHPIDMLGGGRLKAETQGMDMRRACLYSPAVPWNSEAHFDRDRPLPAGVIHDCARRESQLGFTRAQFRRQFDVAPDVGMRSTSVAILILLADFGVGIGAGVESTNAPFSMARDRIRGIVQNGQPCRLVFTSV